MTKFESVWVQIKIEIHAMMQDASLMLARMSDSDKLLGLCLFILVLMFLIIRRPGKVQNAGGMGRQFAMALAIVVIFSFGIDWILASLGATSGRLFG